ncbi:MAG: hypothetical protein FD168_911 [Desulfobulbaceae bacterium]|jgi:hypothetical protein|nr:MAG: hypothetical protein FD168_911 [Desulfobulbaceae bacterium]
MLNPDIVGLSFCTSSPPFFKEGLGVVALVPMGAWGRGRKVEDTPAKTFSCQIKLAPSIVLMLNLYIFFFL